MRRVNKMIKITNENYGLYKEVYEVIIKYTFKDFPSMLELEYSPINILESWEKENMSIAKKGLRHSLLDSLAMIKEMPMPYNDRIILNKKLLDSNLPGLWEMMAIVNDIPAKVLKRGKIKNIDELYVIKEILDNVDSEFSKKELKQLDKLFHEFGMKVSNKKK